MRTWIMSMAALMVVGLIGVSDARAAKKDKKKGDAGATIGVIEKISGSTPALTLTVKGHGKKATAVTITTNEKTSVTVDAQAKKVSDLKVGQQVKLSASSGVASSIDATSATATGKTKGDKKKKKIA